MAVNSVDKAISYDDDDSEERVGFRRGGSRRGGGRRGGRGGGGRRGSRRGRGGARRGSRSPRGNRARANRNKAKRSRTGRTTSRDKQVAGMRRDSARAASGQQTRRGTTTTSKDVSKEAAKKSSSVTSKSNQAQQEKANVTGGYKPGKADFENTMGTKYTGNLQGAIAAANKKHYDRSLQGRKEQAAINAIQAGEAKQVSPEWSSIRSKVAGMETARENLLNKAKQNNISNEELNQLSQMNRDIGLNETTGMGIMESLKYQGTRPEMARDLEKTKAMLGKIPTPMNILRKLGTGLLTDFGNIKDAVTGAPKSQRQPGLFASGQDSRGLFGGIGQGIGNFFGGLEIGPSGAADERRGGDRRALNREGIYGGIDPLSSSAVARDADPVLSTPVAEDVVNPTTGAIDYSNVMASSPILSTPAAASTAITPIAAQGTPYRLRDYYAGVLGQDPSIYQTAANGGRIGKMNGGMMIMGDNGVVNNGIGGILSKYKEIRSEL